MKQEETVQLVSSAERVRAVRNKVRGTESPGEEEFGRRDGFEPPVHQNPGEMRKVTAARRIAPKTTTETSPRGPWSSRGSDCCAVPTMETSLDSKISSQGVQMSTSRYSSESLVRFYLIWWHDNNCGHFVLQDSFFWTAVMCASWSGQRAAVRLLLQHGAAWVGVVDTQGRDAKDLALEGMTVHLTCHLKVSSLFHCVCVCVLLKVIFYLHSWPHRCLWGVWKLWEKHRKRSTI